MKGEHNPLGGYTRMITTAPCHSERTVGAGETGSDLSRREEEDRNVLQIREIKLCGFRISPRLRQHLGIGQEGGHEPSEANTAAAHCLVATRCSLPHCHIPQLRVIGELAVTGPVRGGRATRRALGSCSRALSRSEYRPGRKTCKAAKLLAALAASGKPISSGPPQQLQMNPPQFPTFPRCRAIMSSTSKSPCAP